MAKKNFRRYFINEDKGIYNVYNYISTAFMKIFNDQQFVDYLLSRGVMKKIKHYKTAEAINSSIAKTMHKYFKL